MKNRIPLAILGLWVISAYPNLLWLLLVAPLGYLIWKHVRMRLRDAEMRRAGIKEIDRMEGIKFEERLATYFRDCGCGRVEVTARSHDYGADLLVWQDGVKVVVQAKRYNQPVGIFAIQEVNAARDFHKGQAALVITNSCFTSSAINLARRCGIELWDRETLIKNLACPNRRPAATKIRSGR